MTKLADRKPAYCAACFQQESVRHVDFEAAFDGPVLDGESHKVAIDDLILCENCLADAFRLLDPSGLRETISNLEEEKKALKADIAAKDKMIQGFRSTVNELVDHPIKKVAGKPVLEGLDEEQRATVTRERYRRNKRKVAA